MTHFLPLKLAKSNHSSIQRSSKNHTKWNLAVFHKNFCENWLNILGIFHMTHFLPKNLQHTILRSFQVYSGVPKIIQNGSTLYSTQNFLKVSKFSESFKNTWNTFTSSIIDSEKIA